MRVSGRLAIHLPDGTAERDAVLRAFTHFVSRYDAGYAARDEGQRYLELTLD